QGSGAGARFREGGEDGLAAGSRCASALSCRIGHGARSRGRQPGDRDLPGIDEKEGVAAMADLLEVDSAEVMILVDNVTDNLSSTPKFVETELSRLTRRGVNLISW